MTIPGESMAIHEGLPGWPPAGQVAFVFAGGGGLAAGQVGMLRALTEAGIVPDLVVGASAGALNAVAYASDPTPAGIDHLERLWVSLRRRDVIPLSLRRLLAAAAGRGDGLVSAAALRALLADSVVVAPDLGGTVVPAHVVVTDLATGQPVVLHSGDAVNAVLASCAFPGVFPPVILAGRRYVDGGVAADTPVPQAEALGATVCYVLPAAEPTGAPPHAALPLAFHALNQLLGRASHADIAAALGQVHLLPAPAAATANPLALRGTARLVGEGYRLARDWLRHQQRPASPAGRAVDAPVDAAVVDAAVGVIGAVPVPA